jgi:hypothetical protein
VILLDTNVLSALMRTEPEKTPIPSSTVMPPAEMPPITPSLTAYQSSPSPSFEKSIMASLAPAMTDKVAASRTIGNPGIRLLRA